MPEIDGAAVKGTLLLITTETVDPFMKFITMPCPGLDKDIVMALG
jgi:hypothetical protein